MNLVMFESIKLFFAYNIILKILKYKKYKQNIIPNYEFILYIYFKINISLKLLKKILVRYWELKIKI